MLRWIREGARCEWTSSPPPSFHLGVSLQGSSAPTGEESEWLERKILRLSGNGALIAAPLDERTHMLCVHLVPKKTEPGKPKKWRLVIDLRPTNRYCVHRSCMVPRT